MAQKRVINVLEACLRLRRDHPTLRLILAGDGPDAWGIRQWVAERGAEWVEMPGLVEWAEVLKIYARADLLVFTPVMERFGMVVIEALAAGVPVVTTHECGAGRDLIRDGVNGVLVKEDDCDALVEGIRRALSPTTYPRLKENANSVIGQYDVRHEAVRFVESITLALGEEKRAGAGGVRFRLGGGCW
jgi:glycogen(starch) synthase